MQVIYNAVDRARERLHGRLINPHQSQGVQWMLGREMSGVGFPGGVLADEMGLGKTVQTIATMLGNPQPNPTLIVAPKSLLTQWQREIAKFSSLPSFVLRPQYSAHEPERIASKIESLGNTCILATYETVARMPQLAGVRFSRIILDESHRIKNRVTKTYKAVAALQGGIKWCLTGTPITRRPSDFVTLITWIGETAPLDVGYARSTYLMRRTFEDLSKVCTRLALPPCTINNHTLEMSADEKDLYNAMVKYGQFCVRVNTSLLIEGGEGRREAINEILEVLLRLQQIVVSPSIVGESAQMTEARIFDPVQHETSTIPEDDDCPICMQAFTPETACRTSCGHWFCKSCITSAVLCKPGATCPMCRGAIDDASIRCVSGAGCTGAPFSTKLTKIREILEAERGNKVLIFTHWKKEMLEIQRLLSLMGVSHSTIDGRIDVAKRQERVDDFNAADGVQVLISQIQVGGCGLNMQACRTIIFPSLDWSPAVELQAVARAHRIGVDHPVTVHRLIARGSIDDHVIRIQTQKLEYASQLFEDSRVNTKLGFDPTDLHTLAKIFALIQ